MTDCNLITQANNLSATETWEQLVEWGNDFYVLLPGSPFSQPAKLDLDHGIWAVMDLCVDPDYLETHWTGKVIPLNQETLRHVVFQKDVEIKPTDLPDYLDVGQMSGRYHLRWSGKGYAPANDEVEILASDNYAYVSLLDGERWAPSITRNLTGQGQPDPGELWSRLDGPNVLLTKRDSAKSGLMLPIHPGWLRGENTFTAYDVDFVVKAVAGELIIHPAGLRGGGSLDVRTHWHPELLLPPTLQEGNQA